MNPAERATAIRIEFGLGIRVDADELAKLLGLTVDTRLFRSPEVQEITVGDRIGVSDRLTASQRRWVIAHGIGHALLHADSPHTVWFHLVDARQHRDLYEMEAEIFAFNLLVDDSLGGLVESWDLSAYCGVPNHKMALRGIAAY